MLKGIWAAVLTPVGDDTEPDASRAIPYYGDLLRRGCDGINLLGTTGEAMSFGTDQRMRFMELIAASLPVERVMAGTGAASLADAVRLTRHAFDLGFAAALVMPPFFFRDACDDGVVAFFDELFARAGRPRKRVLLYNFPRMSGVAFHLGLIDRLVERFPEAIAGMKDSSNDARLQSGAIAAHPGFLVFPGSEGDLIAAKARGAAGCISGSVALWPELAQAVFAGNAERGDELASKRAALDGLPFIPTVRRLTAVERSDGAWERAMPPNAPLTPEQLSLLQRVGG